MTAKRDNRPVTLSAEKGSALVMMIFIMVVLALLLAALAYITAQSNQNTAYQIASTRAYWAAQSGAEWGTYQITSATGRAARRCFSPAIIPGLGGLFGNGGLFIFIIRHRGFHHLLSDHQHRHLCGG